MLRRKISALRSRTEFGDAVILLFIAAFVREYFWIIPQVTLAWVATIVVSMVVWYFYVMTREPVAERTPREFWLIVALPLVFIYAMRIAYPDVSFDVLNYRLLHSERAMRGTLFVPGDFFPTHAPYNPAPDIVTGICRALLGYRLGTIINLLVMIWTAQLVEKFLRPYIVQRWLRLAGVLLVVMTEHMMFEINNYMADLLALPLLLEAMLLMFDAREARSERARMIRIALLCGASVAFKLTNIAMIIPIALVYAYFLVPHRREWRKLAVSLMLSLMAFVAPLVPFSLYIYGETGSPVFPVYNGIFKSPYWMANSGWDGRWGGFTVGEVLAWPVLMTFKPERLSELEVYSGRISIGFIVALLGLLLVRRDTRTRTLSFIIILGALLWSATTGYIRYGLFIELLAGMLMLTLAATLIKSPRLPRWLKLASASMLCLALVTQVAFACAYILSSEWSMRWTVFKNRRAFISESRNLLQDYSLRKFLSAEDRDMYSGVDVWIESGIKTSGIEVMLNRHAPIIGVRSPEYFVTTESKERFKRTLAAAEGKKMFTLCFVEDYQDALNTLKSRGLAAGETRAVKIPYYSPGNQLNMFFIEVVRANKQLSSQPD